MKLTEKEINDYIDWTVTSNEYHIRQELEWLIDNLNTNAKATVRQVSKEWEDNHVQDNS